MERGMGMGMGIGREEGTYIQQFERSAVKLGDL